MVLQIDMMQLSEQQVKDALMKVAALKDGWDGDGSIGTNPRAVEAAKEYIEYYSDKLKKRPLSVKHGVDWGGVSIEWVSFTWRFTVEVASDGSFYEAETKLTETYSYDKILPSNKHLRKLSKRDVNNGWRKHFHFF